jgi:hypothetical protein
VAADTATKPRQPKPDRASRRRGPVLSFGAGARRSAGLRYLRAAVHVVSARKGSACIHRCRHFPGRKPNAWHTATSRTPDLQPNLEPRRSPRPPRCVHARMLAKDPEVPPASVWYWRCAFAMPIPLSLVGFADALNPWASYRNHPVVRTPGEWHASGRPRPLGRIARGGSGTRRDERGRHVVLRATTRMSSSSSMIRATSSSISPTMSGPLTKASPDPSHAPCAGPDAAALARSRPRSFPRAECAISQVSSLPARVYSAGLARQSRHFHAVLVALNLRTRPVTERRTGIGLTGSAASSVSSCPRRIILTFSPSPTCSSLVNGPSRAS